MLPEDLEAVMAIERDAPTPGWTADSFLTEIQKAYTYAFVAVQGRRVVGHLVFHRVSDEAHIVNLGVHPVFRGRGIGKRNFGFRFWCSLA